jgi:glycerol-3-phosphate acyltransferase PlsY
MTELVYASVLVVVAYFVGSIPIGLLFARARDVNLRDVGSGNIGATNVARALGKKMGMFVLVFDAGKGAVPVAATLVLELDRSADPFFITATGFAAMMGHCYPLWLGFRGGKGVATALGVFLVVDPASAVIAVAIFLVLVALTRIVSLGSLAGAASLPLSLWLFECSDAAVTLAIAGAVLVIFQHRDNLGRLWRRQEPRL